LNGPVYAVAHDAYHPEPNKTGEGHSGSGMLYRWIEPQSCRNRVAVHAIATDDYGLIERWSAEHTDASFRLGDGKQQWALTIDSQEPFDLALHSDEAGQSWRLTEQSGELEFLEDKGEHRS
jgi:hypothetical protein